MRRKVPAAVVAAFALAVLAAPVFALSPDTVDVNASWLVIGTDTTMGAAPSPAIFALGASLPLTIAGAFFFEPGLDLYWQDYTYVSGRAVPTEIETAAAYLAIGALVSLQAGARIPLARGLELGMTVGADALLRFPTWAYYNDPTAVAAAANAWSYFFGMGRFFYPETRMFLRWQIVEMMGLVFSVRAFWPAAHLWDGQGLGLWDELMLSGTLGFSIPLK
jgi:hypothetical protein